MIITNCFLDVTNALTGGGQTEHNSIYWNILHSRNKRATNFDTGVNFTLFGLSETQSNYSIDTTEGIERTQGMLFPLYVAWMHPYNNWSSFRAICLVEEQPMNIHITF